MRNLPLDADRVNLIASGKFVPAAVYAQLSDGSTKRVPDKQAVTDENHPMGAGVPIWKIDVFVDDDESDRAEAVAVTVASYEEPVAKKFHPVKFKNLRATVYVDRGSGRAQVSLKADGIDNGPAVKAA